MKMIVYSQHGEPKEVDGEDIGFEIHGKKFIVHKAPVFDVGFPVGPEEKWTVTETSTGFAVCRGATKKDVIERARVRLATKSAKQMKTAIAKAKRTLKKVLSERKAREAV